MTLTWMSINKSTALIERQNLNILGMTEVIEPHTAQIEAKFKFKLKKLLSPQTAK
jgi:hypothetical protein